MDEINEEFQSIIGKIERQIMFDGAPPVHPAAVAKTSREIRESLTALALRAQQAEQRAERAEEKVGKLLAQLHVSREAAMDVVEQYHKTGIATKYYKIQRSVGSATNAIAEAEKP